MQALEELLDGLLQVGMFAMLVLGVLGIAAFALELVFASTSR